MLLLQEILFEKVFRMGVKNELINEMLEELKQAKNREDVETVLTDIYKVYTA